MLTPLRNNLKRSIILINQNRSIRPSVKVGKEKFQVRLDVRQFKKDEIRVKAATEYIIIEGKQQRKTDNGFVLRQFYRKFKLPEGCSPECVESNISGDGFLTVVAKRHTCGTGLPCERLIPVGHSGSDSGKPGDDQFVKNDDTSMKKDPCDVYVKK